VRVYHAQHLEGPNLLSTARQRKIKNATETWATTLALNASRHFRFLDSPSTNIPLSNLNLPVPSSLFTNTSPRALIGVNTPPFFPSSGSKAPSKWMDKAASDIITIRNLSMSDATLREKLVRRLTSREQISWVATPVKHGLDVRGSLARAWDGGRDVGGLDEA
jgi:hypothetical protein